MSSQDFLLYRSSKQADLVFARRLSAERAFELSQSILLLDDIRSPVVASPQVLWLGALQNSSQGSTALLVETRYSWSFSDALENANGDWRAYLISQLLRCIIDLYSNWGVNHPKLALDCFSVNGDGQILLGGLLQARPQASRGQQLNELLEELKSKLVDRQRIGIINTTASLIMADSAPELLVQQLEVLIEQIGFIRPNSTIDLGAPTYVALWSLEDLSSNGKDTTLQTRNWVSQNRSQLLQLKSANVKPPFNASPQPVNPSAITAEEIEEIELDSELLYDPYDIRFEDAAVHSIDSDVEPTEGQWIKIDGPDISQPVKELASKSATATIEDIEFLEFSDDDFTIIEHPFPLLPEDTDPSPEFEDDDRFSDEEDFGIDDALYLEQTEKHEALNLVLAEQSVPKAPDKIAHSGDEESESSPKLLLNILPIVVLVAVVVGLFLFPKLTERYQNLDSQEQSISVSRAPVPEPLQKSGKEVGLVSEKPLKTETELTESNANNKVSPRVATPAVTSQPTNKRRSSIQESKQMRNVAPAEVQALAKANVVTTDDRTTDDSETTEAEELSSVKNDELGVRIDLWDAIPDSYTLNILDAQLAEFNGPKNPEVLPPKTSIAPKVKDEIELPLEDIETYSAAALSGQLTEAAEIALLSLPTFHRHYTRAQSIVLTHWQKKNDELKIASSIERLMMLPQNQRNPIYLLARAHNEYNLGQFAQSKISLRTARDFWRLCPPQYKDNLELEFQLISGYIKHKSALKLRSKAMASEALGHFERVIHLSEKLDQTLPAEAGKHKMIELNLLIGKVEK